MVQLKSPKSQLSKTFFGIENLLNIKEKHVCVYFEPLIDYSKYFTSSTPLTYLALDQLFIVFQFLDTFNIHIL